MDLAQHHDNWREDADDRRGDDEIPRSPCEEPDRRREPGPEEQRREEKHPAGALDHVIEQAPQPGHQHGVERRVVARADHRVLPVRVAVQVARVEEACGERDAPKDDERQCHSARSLLIDHRQSITKALRMARVNC